MSNGFPCQVTAPQSPQADCAIESNSTNPAPSPSVSNPHSTQMLPGTLGLNGEGVGAGVSYKGRDT
jgi:hypothetical protein